MSGRVEWHSVSDIVRDLSVAQGGVPAAPYATQAVAAMERPPKLHLQEETEEEFYSEFVGGGGELVGPDCTEIQELLTMVKVEEGVGLGAVGAGVGGSRRHRNVALDSIQRLHARSPADMFRRKRDVTSFIHTAAADTVHKTVEVKPNESLPSKEYQPSAEALDRANRYRESRRREEAAAEDVWTRAMRTMKERDQERTNRRGDGDRGDGDYDPPAC